MMLYKNQFVTGKNSSWIGLLLEIEDKTAKILLLLSSRGLPIEREGTIITIELDKIRPTNLTKSQKTKLFSPIPHPTRIVIKAWDYVLGADYSSVRLYSDEFFFPDGNNLELEYYASSTRYRSSKPKNRKWKILSSYYCVGGWGIGYFTIEGTGKITQYRTDMYDFDYLK